MASSALRESGSGVQPTSSTTPASPMLIPPTLRSVSGSASQMAAASAPKNGLVAFRTAAVDAAMCCPANEKSTNGMAEFTMPTIA